MSKKITLKIVLTAMFIALAVVLEALFKIIPGDLPNGGSFNLSMIAIILLGIFVGPVYGVLGGVIFGFLNFFIDGGKIALWQGLFLDYLIAFGVCGLGGLYRKLIFKDNKWSILWLGIAVFTCGFLRYLTSSFSGVLLYGEYAPAGVNPWFYSFVLYNAPYMALNTAVCIAICALTYKQIISINNLILQKSM